MGEGDTEQGDQAGLRGTSCLAVTALVGRSTERHTDPLRLNQRLRGDPMDAIIILAIVLGPPILAIVLYRRFNPTHRPRWRDADREAPHRDWRAGLFYMRGGDSGGGGGGGDSGGGGGDGGGGSS